MGFDEVVAKSVKIFEIVAFPIFGDNIIIL